MIVKELGHDFKNQIRKAIKVFDQISKNTLSIVEDTIRDIFTNFVMLDSADVQSELI